MAPMHWYGHGPAGTTLALRYIYNLRAYQVGARLLQCDVRVWRELKDTAVICLRMVQARGMYPPF